MDLTAFLQSRSGPRWTDTTAAGTEVERKDCKGKRREERKNKEKEAGAREAEAGRSL